jgi:hypothetical protein
MNYTLVQYSAWILYSTRTMILQKLCTLQEFYNIQEFYTIHEFYIPQDRSFYNVHVRVNPTATSTFDGSSYMRIELPTRARALSLSTELTDSVAQRAFSKTLCVLQQAFLPIRNSLSDVGFTAMQRMLHCTRICTGCTCCRLALVSLGVARSAVVYKEAYITHWLATTQLASPCTRGLAAGSACYTMYGYL